MTYITISTPTLFSHAHDFDAPKDVINDLSQLKFECKSEEYLLIHVVSFLGLRDRNEAPSDNIVYGLLSYMFEGCVKQRCHTLPATSLHSFNHMIR